MICLFFNSSNIIKQMCKRKIILIMNSCIREEVRSDFITRVHTSVKISQCTLVIIKFALWRCLVTTFEQWKFSKFSRSSLKQLSKHFRSLHVEFNSEWEREIVINNIALMSDNWKNSARWSWCVARFWIFLSTQQSLILILGIN